MTQTVTGQSSATAQSSTTAAELELSRRIEDGSLREIEVAWKVVSRSLRIGVGGHPRKQRVRQFS
jgi:hypothetical protein